MANPTVNQLAQVMMREFGEDTSNSSLVGQIESWIQDGFDEIGISAEWNYLWVITQFNTVIGTRTYDLGSIIAPQLLDEAISIRNTSNYFSLRYTKRQKLMEMDANILVSGESEQWYVEPNGGESSLIGLYKVPNSIVTMEVLGMLQPMEFSSDTVLPFPRMFIFLLKDAVRVRFKQDDKDYSGADRIQQNFNKNLAKLKQNNDQQIGLSDRMQVVDISTGRDQMVKLDPNHFRN